MYRTATIDCGRLSTTYAIMLAVWAIDCHATMGEVHARIAGSWDLEGNAQYGVEFLPHSMIVVTHTRTKRSFERGHAL
ncbi:hypothetical protein BKA83DRAFT_4248274 [Pisolithus microcarpus]|nr:hypothetical protein BKA83DRAFT_4248274 [Pisolithus microcarpus]